MTQFDVVIVGGGMVGQAFALSMAQKTNASIAIIEPNNPNPVLNDTFHTRVSAITPTSEAFLTKLGILLSESMRLHKLKFGIKILMVI